MWDGKLIIYVLLEERRRSYFGAGGLPLWMRVSERRSGAFCDSATGKVQNFFHLFFPLPVTSSNSCDPFIFAFIDLKSLFRYLNSLGFKHLGEMHGTFNSSRLFFVFEVGRLFKFSDCCILFSTLA